MWHNESDQLLATILSESGDLWNQAVLAQLGETVLFLRPLRQRRTKQKGRFQRGIFIGRVDRTDEVMVA